MAGAIELRDEAVAYLTAGDDEAMLRSLMIALREAAEKEPQESRAAMGLEALGEHCARLLEARLATPSRAAGDWSIPLPQGCRCELCRTPKTPFSEMRGSDTPLAGSHLRIG